MKKLDPRLLLLACALALTSCASPLPQSIATVSTCPTLPPAPAEAMVKRSRLSQDQLQHDLLGDTPTTTQ